MTTAKKSYEGIDKHLLKHWFEDFKTSQYTYTEPILDSVTVELVKHLCDALKQDSHVFIMSIDLLTEYITIQNIKNILIENQLLVIVCIIFICNKHVGEQSDLKGRLITKLYENVTDEDMHIDVLKRMEISILITLQCKLPLYTKVDDLKTFLIMYLQNFDLRLNVTGLCVQILDLVYIYYRRLFYKLKNVYKQNAEGLEAFHKLTTNRLYLPCGILVCALKLTKLEQFVSVPDILTEICDMCEIHQNHIKLLSQYISSIINNSGHKKPSF